MPSTLTPLRYPGGKSQCYNYIREILSCNDMLGSTYVEPFAGGAGLALKLLLRGDVSHIVINDYDFAIYAFWHCVLNDSEALCGLIEAADLSINEWKIQRNVYLHPNLFSILELGFATLYLNRTNRSGVIKGGPIGGHGQENDYRLDARFNKATLIRKIRSIADHKDQITLLNMDAKDFVTSQELQKFHRTFMNFDPPYVKKGAQLYKNAFSEADHRELCELVKRCRRKWIVTYDICPLVAKLYRSYRRSYLDVTYSVQSSKKAKEYIFFSHNLELPPQISLCKD